MNHIFLVKESRAGERRTALVPQDIAALVKQGHTVSVESQSGLEAGYSDDDYRAVGANIVNIDQTNENSYKNAFAQAEIIVRAKRPNHQREGLENRAINHGTIMIGALDPLETGSNHIAEYNKAGIKAYSIDQADLPPTDPMNVLAAMSRLTGKLALQDALSKHEESVHKVVIIGLGQVGKSALEEARHLNLPVSVIVSSDANINQLEEQGIPTHFVDRTLPIEVQQTAIRSIISDADIVITTARQAGQKAPLLIPSSTLDQMKPNAVIVDLPISEGGNVQGSRHDETIISDRGVKITNVSGYPKAMPKEASILWSQASLQFILRLSEGTENLPLVTSYNQGS